MKRRIKISLLLVTFLLLFSATLAYAQENSIVRAVMFYSPTCPHCEEVINNDLPPLQEKYGDALQILLIDASTQQGQELYQSTIRYYEIPDERLGVPMLIVADVVLVGTGEIPAYFPQLIEENLGAGGTDFPSIPGLDAFIAAAGEAAQAAPAKLTMSERFALDPAGNTVSVIVLIVMLMVVGFVAFTWQRPARKREFPVWLVPALSVIGLFVASYLAFVETTQAEAICGPIGDCNTVQQSPYATLFGFLPVGVLGVMGYLSILLAWAAKEYGKAKWHPIATKALLLFTGFGTLFSIYLTFLEPFVIGATCMWCITSALVQTALFWLSAEPAKIYWVKASVRKRPQRKRTKHKTKRKRHRH